MQVSRNEVRKELKKAIFASFINFQFLVIGLLSILVLASSFAVLNEKLNYREETIRYQKLQKQQITLYVEWTQLLLEHSTLASPIRVERLAKDKLNMRLPVAKEIKLVKEL
ncbi:cell division protein FtsL [Thiotrichales bacterium 19S11-10]|nr:cell division protein FtsL [Thiotrichales bacterium 19S11-10]